MSAAALKVVYDDFGDVLYVRRRAEIAQTKNVELVAGLVLRRDLGTNEPVGATVLDYKTYWSRARQRARLEESLASFFGISIPAAKKVLKSARVPEHH